MGNTPCRISREARSSYIIKSKLKEGSRSMVRICKSRAMGEERALKLVSKAETTPSDVIMEEIKILREMSHENIVKVHDTFDKERFLCIVMDLIPGGDLVDGLIRHLRERGPMCYHSVVHVARQMGDSIAYLHSKHVVHRNIKAESYLTDCGNIADPGCRVVLVGFGRATRVEPGKRLAAAVGTKLYWSPEVYDHSYGAKVDVWAMGIIMHGLVCGHFPFRSEKEVRDKKVKISCMVHPICRTLIRRMLRKDEGRRPSSDAFASHAWVDFVSEDAPPRDGEGEDAGAPGMAHGGPDCYTDGQAQAGRPAACRPWTQDVASLLRLGIRKCRLRAESQGKRRLRAESKCSSRRSSCQSDCLTYHTAMGNVEP